MGCGLGFGYVTGWLLRWLRWRGVPAFVEAVATLALSYLLFWVAQGPATGSGVIAVVVYGLYGSATSHWGMLAQDLAGGIHEAVWDAVAFVANVLIFFWAGISAVNVVARSSSSLGDTAWSYAAIPIIYAFMLATRALLLYGFNPIFWLFGKSE